MLYAVIYINVDTPSDSEVYGIYKTKNEAVKSLIECAGYRESKDNQLTQYMEDSFDFTSYQELYDIVCEKLELVDLDIYRIQEFNDLCI